MQRSILGGFALAALFLLLSPVTALAQDFPDLEGLWHAKGVLADGRSYTGEVTFNLARTPAGPRAASRWRFTYDVSIANETGEPTKRSFVGNASYGKAGDGKYFLRFGYKPTLDTIEGRRGILGALGDGLRGRTNRNIGDKYQINVLHEYSPGWFDNEAFHHGTFSVRGHVPHSSGDNGWRDVRDARNTDKGAWLKSWHGVETLIKDTTPMKITGLEPAAAFADTEQAMVTVKGERLPSERKLTADKIAFLNGDTVDPEIEVVDIVDVDDDWTRARFIIKVGKNAVLGKRSIRIMDTVGEGMFEIVELQRIKLGHTATLENNTVTNTKMARLYIPDRLGGKLTIRPAGATVRFKDMKGTPLAAGADGVFAIEKDRHGWYFVESDADVTTTFKQIGEVLPENKPYNFWYFPFFDRPGANQNLYDDGGGYEKLDKVAGNVPTGARFDVGQHMDKRTKQKKWGNKTFTEEKTFAEAFKEFSDDEKAKHDPSTMKGYAYCYQRSMDDNKSWWGHCWGAVVASSLFRAPSGGVSGVATADGGTIDFTEEEVEGLLTSFYTNHGVRPYNFMSDCPAGRPTDAADEKVDSFADDWFHGLRKGIAERGVPLASNLRAEMTSDREEDKSQVWNHVVWYYEATLKEADGDDPTLMLTTITVKATNDVFPSSEPASPRVEKYDMGIKFRYTPYGDLDRDGEGQNWVSASHYAPSYLWRIEKSSGRTTDNKPLRDYGIDKLSEIFKLERIEAARR